ncbi:VOC family protein [Chryseobacterium sp. cx-311]|uniref:VOC family protein n=1 Tax=Marnyiella aurantia TaxID=2758037 RepID=UPI001AE30536|nr:VOC family protein [Marnyiella aurantia]MBP0612868.1 VOC family protein [Marnyiella aurantia]
MKRFQKVHTILYVTDQTASTEFYRRILGMEPVLDVAGMTEFEFSDYFTLGLMPRSSINKILQGKTEDPASGSGIPRCELYLYVDDTEAEYQNAVALNAKVLSAPANRDWGDHAFYLADPDGHIVAFAKQLKN